MYKKAIEVLNIFFNNGFDAYIVGGYVRDKLLDIKTNDIDICTNAKPKDIVKLFDIQSSDETQYGAVKIIYKNYNFDVTTFRKDIKYEDNRKPIKIKYINNLKKDLLRRDFTINTICIDKDNNYVVADLPGLIEGASQGLGLGFQFLRHIERCRVIVHVIDIAATEGRDPYEDYLAIGKPIMFYEDEETDFIKKEFEMLGLYLSIHPLTKIKEKYHKKVTLISEIENDGYLKMDVYAKNALELTQTTLGL